VMAGRHAAACCFAMTRQGSPRQTAREERRLESLENVESVRPGKIDN
jgi:hypothetical protein